MLELRYAPASMLSSDVMGLFGPIVAAYTPPASVLEAFRTDDGTVIVVLSTGSVCMLQCLAVWTVLGERLYGAV